MRPFIKLEVVVIVSVEKLHFVIKRKPKLNKLVEVALCIVHIFIKRCVEKCEKNRVMIGMHGAAFIIFKIIISLNSSSNQVLSRIEDLGGFFKALMPKD